jgi:hypothetical protein
MTATLTPQAPAGRYGLEQTAQAEVTKIASLRSSLMLL